MPTPADIFKALALLGNILSLVYLAVFLLSLRAALNLSAKRRQTTNNAVCCKQPPASLLPHSL